MPTDRWMRRTLIAGAVFNAFAALVVLFPDTLGAFADLPPAAPRFHRALLALFIALFGGVYAWLAVRPTIDRPLITIAALGKLGVFAIAIALWSTGDLSTRALTPAVVDLMFGLVFVGWLRGR
jgi:hypothetical protein